MYIYVYMYTSICININVFYVCVFVWFPPEAFLIDNYIGPIIFTQLFRGLLLMNLYSETTSSCCTLVLASPLVLDLSSNP